ncbi:MAG: RHS repeat-associated core domain-containing protein, partial [Nitrososphaera sp.]|nr:RHS repeat-associated core domain-containing protein [Nitrososphaera sp.]
DQINTPRAITDTSGTVHWKWDSDPFGVGSPDQDPDGDGVGFVYNLRMPEQYFDAETGLHYNYYRDYDPSVGRYVQSDPIGLEGGLNTYAYVANDPLSITDTFGLLADSVTNTCRLRPDLCAALGISGAAALSESAKHSSSVTPSEETSEKECGDKKCATCKDTYPERINCNQLTDYPYWNWSGAISQFPAGATKHAKRRATDGPCSVDSGYTPGTHWNIRGGRGKGSDKLGSISSCPCCQDTDGGPRLREKFRSDFTR